MKVNVYHIGILIHGSPQVILFAINLHEDLVNVECITIASVLLLQSAGKNGPELFAPKANCFTANGNASLGQ
jgi:hypothetical protein